MLSLIRKRFVGQYVRAFSGKFSPVNKVNAAKISSFIAAPCTSMDVRNDVANILLVSDEAYLFQTITDLVQSQGIQGFQSLLAALHDSADSYSELLFRIYDTLHTQARYEIRELAPVRAVIYDQMRLLFRNENLKADILRYSSGKGNDLARLIQEHDVARIEISPDRYKRRSGHQRALYYLYHEHVPKYPVASLSTAFMPLIPRSMLEVEKYTGKISNLSNMREWDPKESLWGAKNPIDGSDDNFTGEQWDGAPKELIEEQRLLQRTSGINPIPINRNVLHEDYQAWGVPRTVIFYSVNTHFPTIKFSRLGIRLIRQAAQHLANNYPVIQNYLTFSPIPNFSKFVLDNPEIVKDQLKRFIEKEGDSVNPYFINSSFDEIFKEIVAMKTEEYWWAHKAATRNAILPLLSQILQHYLLECRLSGSAGRPLCPVMHFHLGNGAKLHRIVPGADVSTQTLMQSFGFMVNYCYSLKGAEGLHETFSINSVRYEREPEAVIQELNPEVLPVDENLDVAISEAKSYYY